MVCLGLGDGSAAWAGGLVGIWGIHVGLPLDITRDAGGDWDGRASGGGGEGEAAVAAPRNRRTPFMDLKAAEGECVRHVIRISETLPSRRLASSIFLLTMPDFFVYAF